MQCGRPLRALRERDRDRGGAKAGKAGKGQEGRSVGKEGGAGSEVAKGRCRDAGAIGDQAAKGGARAGGEAVSREAVATKCRPDTRGGVQQGCGGTIVARRSRQQLASATSDSRTARTARTTCCRAAAAGRLAASGAPAGGCCAPAGGSCAPTGGCCASPGNPCDGQQGGFVPSARHAGIGRRWRRRSTSHAPDAGQYAPNADLATQGGVRRAAAATCERLGRRTSPLRRLCRSHGHAWRQ